MEATIEKITLQTYPAYKDSGVEWLGEIPEHWEILPGLSFIYENKDRNKGMIRNTVLSLSYGKIRVKGENELTGLVPESFETYQFVNKGDLIFRPTDLQNDTVSLRSSISEYEGIITNAYLNLRFRPKANSKFYHYFFRSIDNNKIIYGLGSGLRQNISYLDFRRFPFPFPPKEEQAAIAKFLDDKTTKIDQAIGIKQKQIELLKERRQILIHKAVTRGLNENVKLKDSGVEWIGKIPEHWEVKRLKHITTKIVDGAHFTPTYVEQGVPFLRVTDLSDPLQKSIDWNSVKYIPLKEHLELIKRANPEKGDILLSKNGTIGLTKVIEWDEEFSFFVSLCLIKPKKMINSHYFSFFFNSPLVDQQVSFGSSRTSVTNLHLEKIKELLIVLPPINEQLLIIKGINNIIKPIDEFHHNKRKEIEKLKEYKMSLIDGVVTGKVKVC
jgi:type I restriction enzyme S subunit